SDEFVPPLLPYPPLFLASVAARVGQPNLVRISGLPMLRALVGKLGAYVADAMWSYTGTDDDNATDIDRAGGRH
ncbi:hypothetical protein AB0N23_32495, partial [Streptomyces sp. NPDC052644]